MTNTSRSTRPPLPVAGSGKDLFTTTARIQAWLDVEAALAQSQAELGMIPPRAAREIVRKAHLDGLDQPALLEDMAATRAPVVSLVRFLAAACEGDAGDYVHWGATTQNVMQTGEVLLVREAHRRLLAGLACCLDVLAAHAEDGATVIMAGRTQRRHALPITFGFKVAGWIDELLRHEQRLHEVESRVFTLVFGGAVGAMHSFDGKGEELSQRLARHLRLGCFDVPSRSVNDHMVEYVLLLALLGSTCSKIADELFVLMSEEIGEVYEELDSRVVGSSTMPQKANPKICVSVTAMAAQLRAQVGLALEAMRISHEGDAASTKMLYTALETACPLALEMISTFAELLEKVRVVPEKMRRNLALTGGLINGENVMLLLARQGLGRQRAHDVVHEAALQAVRDNRSLTSVLAETPDLRGVLQAEQLSTALRPEHYLGDCEKLARKLAGRARTNAKRIHIRANGLGVMAR